MSSFNYLSFKIYYIHLRLHTWLSSQSTLAQPTADMRFHSLKTRKRIPYSWIESGSMNRVIVQVRHRLPCCSNQTNHSTRLDTRPLKSMPNFRISTVNRDITFSNISRWLFTTTRYTIRQARSHLFDYLVVGLQLSSQTLWPLKPFSSPQRRIIYNKR